MPSAQLCSGERRAMMFLPLDSVHTVNRLIATSELVLEGRI
jgi:hypothetical protein